MTPTTTKTKTTMQSPRPSAEARCYFTRSRYSPVFGFTRTRSPLLTNSGTFTVTPFSSRAGFVDAVFVADFITGEVSTIASSIAFGSSMPIGRPLDRATARVCYTRARRYLISMKLTNARVWMR